MIVTAKVVAIFFGLATLAFCVSTIVLAVQNSNLEDDLQDARNKLEVINAATTSTTSTTTTSIDTTTTSITETTQSPTSIPTSTAATTSTQPVNPIETTTKPSTNSSTTEFPYPTLTIPTDGTTTTTLAPGFNDPNKIVYRLPTDLRPIKYRLYFHPDLQLHTSENTVSVQVEVENVTNLIVMHAKNIQIDGISILNMMLRMRISIKRFYLSEKRELLIIELNELLRKATPYVVSISYRNNLDGLSGIYASSYLDENGDNK